MTGQASHYAEPFRQAAITADRSRVGPHCQRPHDHRVGDGALSGPCDKDSGIKNDPNDWCTEVGDPRYIVDLVKRVTRVSIETMKVVDTIPKWEPEGQTAQPEANYDAMGDDRGQWAAEKG